MKTDHRESVATGSRPRRTRRLLGIALVSSGVLLLVAVGAYFGYSLYSRSQLDRLNASAEAPLLLPQEAVLAGFVPVDTSVPKSPLNGEGAISPGVPTRSDDVLTISVQSDSGRTVIKARPPIDSRSLSGSELESPEASGFTAYLYAPIYPGYQMHPKYWSEPLWAGTDPYSHVEPALPPEYTPVSSDIVAPRKQTAQARRISIPIIDLDAKVNELRILNLGDSRSYETPKNVVGHIPQTANPGEEGNGWFFGHLESPIRGEGSIFRRLPRIAELLPDGDPVYITIESADGEFLYQVTETYVVHEDDLQLSSSDDPSITLVTCVPRLVYDHRLVVTAELVGTKS